MNIQYSKKSFKLAIIGILAVALGIGTTSIFVYGAVDNSVQKKIQVLLDKLHFDSQQEIKTNQIIETPQGKMFVGQSEEKIKQLHDETQKQIDNLIARPIKDREIVVSEIKKFINDSSIVVNYKNTSKSSYNSNIPVEIYIADTDQYEVDARNNKIIQFGPRPLLVGEKSKEYDNSSRYSVKELELMARQFITKQAPDVNLDNLTQNFGNKDGINYFFRWEDVSRETEDMYPFVQVGFSRGGSLLSYTNSLGL